MCSGEGLLPVMGYTGVCGSESGRDFGAHFCLTILVQNRVLFVCKMGLTGLRDSYGSCGFFLLLFLSEFILAKLSVCIPKCMTTINNRISESFTSHLCKN